jgi:hypothetical protein
MVGVEVSGSKVVLYCIQPGNARENSSENHPPVIRGWMGRMIQEGLAGIWGNHTLAGHLRRHDQHLSISWRGKTG